MAQAFTKVTVSTTAVAIPTTMLTSRTSFIMKNNGPNTVYIGGSGVTVATGVPLRKGEKVNMGVNYGDPDLAYYGICETGEVAEVAIWEFS